MGRELTPEEAAKYLKMGEDLEAARLRIEELEAKLVVLTERIMSKGNGPWSL